MYSDRIKCLARDVSLKDVVLDVGCDHGYLSIYLKKNKLCKEVYACDISKNALEGAKRNFQKYQVDIEAFVSNGFDDIPVSFNTAVIAGMGTHTILKILDSPKIPPKLIISSNNDLYLLRKSLNKLGYKLIDEVIVYENKHYYTVMLYIKNKQKLNKWELMFGVSNDDDYYKYLLHKNKELLEKVPWQKKRHLKKCCRKLKGLIERK